MTADPGALVTALRAASTRVTKAREFQCLRRDRDNGDTEYQIYADTEKPRDGIQIGYVQSTRFDAEFIALALECAPYLAALLHAAEATTPEVPLTPTGNLIAQATEWCGRSFDDEVTHRRLITEQEREAAEIIKGLLILVEPDPPALRPAPEPDALAALEAKWRGMRSQPDDVFYSWCDYDMEIAASKVAFEKCADDLAAVRASRGKE